MDSDNKTEERQVLQAMELPDGRIEVLLEWEECAAGGWEYTEVSEDVTDRLTQQEWRQSIAHWQNVDGWRDYYSPKDAKSLGVVDVMDSTAPPYWRSKCWLSPEADGNWKIHSTEPSPAPYIDFTCRYIPCHFCLCDRPTIELELFDLTGKPHWAKVDLDPDGWDVFADIAAGIPTDRPLPIVK